VKNNKMKPKTFPTSYTKKAEAYLTDISQSNKKLATTKPQRHKMVSINKTFVALCLCG